MQTLVYSKPNKMNTRWMLKTSSKGKDTTSRQYLKYWLDKEKRKIPEIKVCFLPLHSLTLSHPPRTPPLFRQSIEQRVRWKCTGETSLISSMRQEVNRKRNTLETLWQENLPHYKLTILFFLAKSKQAKSKQANEDATQNIKITSRKL